MDFKFLYLTSIFIFSLLMASVSVAQPTDLGKSSRIKVGVIAPLSGALAEFGVANRNGIELAREVSGIDDKVEFVFEDSQYDPKIAVTAFQKLRDIDRVAIVFNWGTGPSQAVAPIADASKIPLLAMSTESALSSGREYVLRFSIYAEQFSMLLLKYLKAKGYKRVAIINSEVAYLNEVLAGLNNTVGQPIRATRSMT